MRHKWGSCTSQGTVTLAHDLVDRSDEFQDYVIVHELLHMRYANHGRVFKALMSAYVPSWQSLETSKNQRPPDGKRNHTKINQRGEEVNNIATQPSARTLLVCANAKSCDSLQ
jgi:predicted metal-dependent hydrolase